MNSIRSHCDTCPIISLQRLVLSPCVISSPLLLGTQICLRATSCGLCEKPASNAFPECPTFTHLLFARCLPNIIHAIDWCRLQLTTTLVWRRDRHFILIYFVSDTSIRAVRPPSLTNDPCHRHLCPLCSLRPAPCFACFLRSIPEGSPAKDLITPGDIVLEVCCCIESPQ